VFLPSVVYCSGISQAEKQDVYSARERPSLTTHVLCKETAASSDSYLNSRAHPPAGQQNPSVSDATARSRNPRTLDAPVSFSALLPPPPPPPSPRKLTLPASVVLFVLVRNDGLSLHLPPSPTEPTGPSDPRLALRPLGTDAQVPAAVLPQSSEPPLTRSHPHSGIWPDLNCFRFPTYVCF